MSNVLWTVKIKGNLLFNQNTFLQYDSKESLVLFRFVLPTSWLNATNTETF